MRNRPYLWSILASLLGAGQLLAACSGDDTAAPGDTTHDAGVTPDADQESDGGPIPELDAAPDPEDATPDAGPTVERSLGPTGLIQIFDDSAFAYFFEDDTVLRASDTPECVAYVRSETKPASPAGGIDIIGSDGTDPVSIRVEPDETNFYGAFDPVFPAGEELDLKLEMNATAVFPAIGVQTLRTPLAGSVSVNQPTAPAKGKLEVPSDRDFVFTWDVPTTTDGLRMQLHFADITSTNGRRAQIACTYPLAAGTARIPASLLDAVKAQLGGSGEGFVYTFAGGGGELVVAGTSYVLIATRQDSTTLGQFELIEANLK